MTEWLEFIVFLVSGAWLLCAGLFVAWTTAALPGQRDINGALFCVGLLLGGLVFLWTAFRDAPFTVIIS